MANYTKIYDYAAKDALLTGNPLKIVKGTEIGADFDAVATAISTKFDSGGASSGVEYTPAGTGAVATTVQAKLRESVSVKDFGATGDGVTDDTVALNYALAASNRDIDGGFLTYKVSAALTAVTADNITLRNMTIDSSSTTTTDPILKFEGTRETSITITTNVAAGDSAVIMTSTAAITVGQYLYVGSDAYYSTTQASKIGQIVRVKTVDSGTQVTLYSPTLYDFNTADSAYVQPLTTRKNITLDNVSMIGNATAAVLGEAVRADTCESFTATNCSFKNYNYAAIRIDRAVHSRVVGSSFMDAVGVGYSYGVAVTYGCCDSLIDGCRGENLRHLVTTGGTLGVNIFTRAINNYATAMWDAGLDCHCNSDFTDYSHNHIELSAATAREGIIIQGGSVNIVGNTIVGSGTSAIFYQTLTDGRGVSINIANNILNVLTDRGISVYTSVGYTSTIDGLNISGNVIKGTACISHIRVSALEGDIRNITISNNICESFSTGRSLYIAPANGAKIERVAITGNVAKADTTQPVCFLDGDSSSAINDVTISGNNFTGGTYSTWFDYVTNAVVSGNLNIAPLTSLYRLDSTSSKIATDSMVLASNATAVSCAANTTENTLATIVIPAHMMGVTGQVRVTTLWTVTSSGNNKVVRVKFGGTEYLTGTITTAVSSQTQTVIRNRTTATQVGYVAATVTTFGTNAGAVVTSSVDTTADVTMLITGQKASSGETLTLESYTVEVFQR